MSENPSPPPAGPQMWYPAAQVPTPQVPTAQPTQQWYPAAQVPTAYPPQQSYPAPVTPWQVPPPAPRRRYGLGVLLTVAIVVGLIAGSGGMLAGAALRPAGGTPVGAAAAGTTEQAPTTDAGTPDNGATLADGKALLAKILQPPAGTTPRDVSGTTDGVMNLDQFIAKVFSSHPDAARVVLQGDNFKVAAQRNWVTTDNVQVGVQLVQFATEANSQRYLQNQIDAYQSDQTVTGKYEIPDVAMGNGFEKSGPDAAGNHRSILIAEYTFYAVFLFIFTPHDYDRTAGMDVVRQELNLLNN